MCYDFVWISIVSYVALLQYLASTPLTVGDNESGCGRSGYHAGIPIVGVEFTSPAGETEKSLLNYFLAKCCNTVAS